MAGRTKPGYVGKWVVPAFQLLCTWRERALGHPELLTLQPGGLGLFGETISDRKKNEKAA